MGARTGLTLRSDRPRGSLGAAEQFSEFVVFPQRFNQPIGVVSGEGVQSTE